jgi:hypothetical protein
VIEGKVIVAVDFDGTITNERDMGDVMTLKEGAKEVLTSWYNDDVTLILWTCRAGKVFEDACSFLVENDMLHLFSAFNDQYHEINDKYHPDVARKVGADFYIDDRNLGTIIDWKQIQLNMAYVLKQKAI